MLLSAYQPLPQKELDIGQNLCFPLQFLFILMNNIPYDKTFTPISDMETSDYFEPKFQSDNPAVGINIHIF